MRVRRPEDSTCVLTFDVLPVPAPIEVSQGATPAKATLRITLTNHSDGNVFLDEARFSFPVGDGPGDLTANAHSAVPKFLGQGDGAKWTFRHDQDAAPGTLELYPRSNGKFGPGEELRLAVTDIEINFAVGTSELSIAEYIKNVDDPNGEVWPLAKVPAGFTVGDFRPRNILVRRGRSAELTWRGETGPGVTYTILHDGEPCDVTGQHSWMSAPLHRDTAFALVVEVEGDEDVAEYAMTTMVTVARPDLVVRNLTVGGRVLLTDAPTEFDLAEETRRTFTAQTDGLLVGHVRADEDVPDSEDPAPTLSVTVTTGGTRRTTSIQSHRAERAPGDPGNPLTAVVPQGSTVEISRAGTTPSTHRLTWTPFGTGELKAVGAERSRHTDARGAALPPADRRRRS